MPIREISVGPLGYITVKENDKTLIEDGFITTPMNNADLGIITDQAAVLWFDKMSTQESNSLSKRRKELPLPLFRPIHY